MTLLKAIATEEGFYLEGSRAQRNNNPGNLDWGPFSESNGATRIEVIPDGYDEQPRFAYFPTVEIGFAALQALLSGPDYNGLSLEQAIHKYAPASENNTLLYIQHVCAWCECLPTTPISTLMEAA